MEKKIKWWRGEERESAKNIILYGADLSKIR